MLRKGEGREDVPESIRSDIRAGVPAPMATLFIVSMLALRYMRGKMNAIPSTFKELLGFCEFDVFGEELADGRFFGLECAKGSVSSQLSSQLMYTENNVPYYISCSERRRRNNQRVRRALLLRCFGRIRALGRVERLDERG